MTLLVLYFLTGLILAPFSYAMTLADLSEWYQSGGMKRSAYVQAITTVIFPPHVLVTYCLTGFAKHGLKWK